MKTKIIYLFLLLGFSAFSQKAADSIQFKKRVLESTEVDFLLSYYQQDGAKSAVSGGIGSEELTDIATNIVVVMPLNDDAVLTVDLGISAYSSASSSNINPYDNGGKPTPWQASSTCKGKISFFYSYGYSYCWCVFCTTNRNFGRRNPSH